MDDNPAISKRIAFAFHPKYTLSEKQLMKYRNDLGSYDIESDEIDDALEFSREKLKDVLRNIGVNQEQQPDQPQQPAQQQPDQPQQPQQPPTEPAQPDQPPTEPAQPQEQQQPPTGNTAPTANTTRKNGWWKPWGKKKTSPTANVAPTANTTRKNGWGSWGKKWGLPWGKKRGQAETPPAETPPAETIIQTQPQQTAQNTVRSPTTAFSETSLRNISRPTIPKRDRTNNPFENQPMSIGGTRKIKSSKTRTKRR